MSLSLVPVTGMPEVRTGDDVATLAVPRIREALGGPLLDGDVVVVTSKVVSKAAGLVVEAERSTLLHAATDRVVARRGPLRIVRTPHGLVLAAGGVDASNTRPGTSVPLPPDPDADARTIRARLHELTGRRVGVVITDTAGRAWREGQTDLAVGVAGLRPLVPLAGHRDPYGNDLEVTAPAVADAVAAAADLVAGKTAGVPIVVVRGLDPDLLLVEDGPGAGSLVRAEETDLFGLGSVDAVLAAVTREDPDGRGFPVAPPDALSSVAALAADGTGCSTRVREHAVEVVPAAEDREGLLEAGAVAERVRVLAAAHRLRPEVRVLGG